MRIHRIHSRQHLATSLEQAWDFFSTPANLPAITPDWLNFQITSDVPPQLTEGLAISYTITPLLNVRVSWLTVIVSIDAPSVFVDEQCAGPYQLWHHRHEFEAVEGGVEARDIVHYALPFDPFSRPLHDLIVRRQLESIFRHRYGALAEHFGSLDAATDGTPPPGAIVFSMV